MNYKKIYDSLCLRGKLLRENLEYSECHHIIPKCMGGDNSSENLTKLTAREHYIAHYLLVKMYPKNYKLLCAFGMMKNTNGFQNRIFTSKQYSIMKAAYSKAMKLNNPMKNRDNVLKTLETKAARYKSGEISIRNLSEQEKCDISNRMKGSNNPTNRFPEKHNFKNNSYVLGKFCYNNGVKNKYFFPDDIIPEGFVKGTKPYKRIRNGVESNHG
jgi:hypothetical protein